MTGSMSQLTPEKVGISQRLAYFTGACMGDLGSETFVREVGMPIKMQIGLQVYFLLVPVYFL